MHTVKWFQVLLHNSHNLTSVICLRTVCSIWPIERTLSGATTPGQSGPGSNGNKGVLHITQISKARASLSDSLLSYPGHVLHQVFSLDDSSSSESFHILEIMFFFTIKHHNQQLFTYRLYTKGQLTTFKMLKSFWSRSQMFFLFLP